MLTQNFKKDFLYLIERVFKNKINTSFVRFNEGEYSLLIGKHFVGAGGLWRTYENSLLQKDLLKTLYINSEDYIYGIASIQHIEANQWYKTMIGGQITFATLFANDNYKYFAELIKNIKEEVILIGNENGVNNVYPFKVKEYIGVPFDVVGYYEENKEEVLKICKKLCKNKNKLILFSAGPLSNIMIYECYIRNPNNRYIDVGSTLDLYIHLKPTRQYFFINGKTSKQIDIL